MKWATSLGYIPRLERLRALGIRGVYTLRILMLRLLLVGVWIVSFPSYGTGFWPRISILTPGLDLKYDNCGVPQTWGQDLYHNCHPDYPSPSTKIHGFNQTCIDDPNLAPPGYDWSQSSTAARFYRMRDALERQDRTILLSLCQWGQAGVTQWGPNTGISWRISDDIFRKFLFTS